MEAQVRKVVEDMEAVAASGKYTLDAQVRAYDLLERLFDVCEGSSAAVPSSGADFLRTYSRLADRLKSAWDGEVLHACAKEALRPHEDACNEARFKAAAAASLHEFAKEVFEIWQKGGIFARRRALRELRQRAGFRLESHRIGNYVAKTFDLMNEADACFARAQRQMFSANVSYKIHEDTYGKIADFFAKVIGDGGMIVSEHR